MMFSASPWLTDLSEYLFPNEMGEGGVRVNREKAPDKHEYSVVILSQTYILFG